MPQLRHPLWAVGALLSAASIGFFVSLIRFDMGDNDHSDVVVTILGFLLAGMLLAIVVPRVAGL